MNAEKYILDLLEKKENRIEQLNQDLILVGAVAISALIISVILLADRFL